MFLISEQSLQLWESCCVCVPGCLQTVVILWTLLLEWWVASIALSLPFVKILTHTAEYILHAHIPVKGLILLYHAPPYRLR